MGTVEIENKENDEEASKMARMELLKRIKEQRKLDLDLEGVHIIKGSFGVYYAQLKDGRIFEFGINESGQI